MRNFKNLLLLFAITLITNSCSDLPRIIKLTWGDIEYVNQTTLIVTDTLVDINVDVTEFGHIWSETNPNLEYGNTGITTISSSGSPSDNGFSSIITGLEEGKTYYVRAYAKNRKDLEHGDVRDISPSSILIDLESVEIPNGGNPFAIGRLLSLGTGVNEYGFIWSKDTIPSYNNHDGILPITTNIQVGEFSRSITGLDLNTTYHFRAYAKGVSISYSDVITITTPVFNPNSDSWQSVFVDPGFPARYLSTSFVIGNKAYIMGGKRAPYSVWEEASYLKDTWEFTPPNQWVRKQNMPPGMVGNYGLYEASSFSMNGYGYHLGGLYIANGVYRENEIWQFDPNDNSSVNASGNPMGKWRSVGNIMTPRIGAVAFSVGGHAYYGLGFTNGYDYYAPGGYSLNDFHQISHTNPTSSAIQQVPLASFKGGARFRAISFVLNGKAYVGMGRKDNDSEPISDLWEFIPPNSSNNHLGDWVEVANVSSIIPARFSAFAFVANGKAYIGTGETNNGKSADIYELTPLSDGSFQIVKKNDFPAPISAIPLNRGLAFTIDNIAYAGTGISSNGAISNIFKYNQ